MRSPFATELARSIKGSLGRFLAIAGIAALGCGFYAGLGMTGADMRSAADAFYDDTNLYDVRLVSTLGFGKSQVAEMAKVDGVEAVMPAYATDVMATLGGEQYAMRFMSLPTDVATGVAGDATLNRPILLSGRWPTESDELVLSGDRKLGTPVRVGDKVTVLYGSSDLDGVLKRRTFTVTGLVRSSSFASSVGLGYTNLGTGIIDQYAYLSESAFDDDLPYTEVYVAAAGAKDELSGSDDYQATVDGLASRLEKVAPKLAADRLAEVKADAQKQVDDAREKYERGRDESAAQLADAKAKLDAAREGLDAAEARLASGRERLAAGKAELDEAGRQAAAQLAASASQLDAADAAIAAGRDQIRQANSDLVERRAELEDAKAKIDAADEQWQESRADLVRLADAYDAACQGVAQAQAAVDALEGKISALPPDADGATRDQLQALLDTANTQLEQAVSARDAIVRQAAQQGLDVEALRDTIAAGDKGIADARAELDYDANKAGLDTGQAELDANAAALDEQAARLAQGRRKYASAKASAEARLASGRAKLDESAAQLATGKAELDEGRRSYASGLASYQTGVAEADARLADAASQLERAQAEVDDIEQPDVYVLDRTKNAGAASYQSDSERIDNIAAVFPFIFFLVAALVSLTTMTRMVEDERVEIGTHKALGFSTAYIAGRYVAYAAIASGVGSMVGILVLSQVLPWVVETAYAIMYCVPLMPFPLPIRPAITATSIAMGVGVTLLATFAAAAATLRETPAALMLPRAPKPGKRILLERIRPVWSRLSFSWKVTLRNLFRYKRRLAMTVVGVAGCTALLLTGLGLHDSINDIIDRQYLCDDPIFSYNIVVGVDADDAQEVLGRVSDTLARKGDASGVALVDVENMQARGTTDTDVAARVMVPTDPVGLTRFVRMRDRVSGKSVDFGDDSVVLSEKLATRLGVRVGDEVSLYDQDDIGNASGKPHVFTVTGVVENYIADYAYVGPVAWRNVMGADAAADTVLANVGDDDSTHAELSEALHDTDGVSTVTFNTETIGMYQKSLRSVNMIVVVLVVAAAALAFIVLYNLTNINVIERTREIASLKVLGFTRREVSAYVFREVVLLVAIGAALGLVLGVGMEHFVILSAEVDAVMFGRDIHLPSFAMAFAGTMLFSVLVMGAMVPKLRRIDMVESLKSVD